jgi:predicted esterase
VTRHTDAYRPGRLVEVMAPVGARGAPVVLFWHGSGPDERDALVPLASAVAAHGTVTLVPDWQSDDFAVGADELVASIEFALATAVALGGDPGRVALAGWSLGASAAADIALHPALAGGWHPSGLVGLGGAYDRTPFGGHPAREPLAGASVSGAGRQALFVHGTSDTVVPLERSVVGTGALAEAGWRAVLRQVGTDHAGVIGTVYDRGVRRCVPSDEPARLHAMATVAREVARIALGPELPGGMPMVGV